MNILIIGGGGREHALLSQYSKSSKVKKLFCLPGNGLMDYKSEKPVKIFPNIKPTDKSRIWEIVKKEKINIVDVAQDNPLAEGLVDFLQEKKVDVFGPTKFASQIEWDKEWSREFMKRHHLPIPSYEVFSSIKKAKDHIKRLPKGSFFVKASGLAAGKGAIQCDNREELIEAIDLMKIFGDSGRTFLIEEALIGEEASIYAISDGNNYKILKSAQDNKQINNYDQGPNTGGMGANSPALVTTDRRINKNIEHIIANTIKGMSDEGIPYKGVLYLGIIIDKKKNIKIIEFNARWGDPEAQVVLPGIKNDYVSIVEACIKGNLNKLKISEDNKTRVCVVGASKGYPDDYSAVRGKEIFGLEKASKIGGVEIYGAGIKRNGKRTFAEGGRIINVIGEGNDMIWWLLVLNTDSRKWRRASVVRLRTSKLANLQF